jgi:hypothetical protein
MDRTEALRLSASEAGDDIDDLVARLAERGYVVVSAESLAELAATASRAAAERVATAPKFAPVPAGPERDRVGLRDRPLPPGVIMPPDPVPAMPEGVTDDDGEPD